MARVCVRLSGLAAFLFFVVPIHILFAEELRKPEWVFLGNANIAPVVYLSNGRATGLAVDLVRKMAPYLDRPVRIEAMDWTAAQQLVAQGEADALVQINRTEEREAIYDFSDPLLESAFSVFTLTRKIGLNGIKDLRGLKVGVEASGLPRQVLGKAPDVFLTIIPNFVAGFDLLTKGAVDAVVVDNRVGTYVLAQNNLRNIGVSGEPIAASFSRIAVKKGNRVLLDQINAALKTIRANGVYQDVLDRWKPEEVVFQTREQVTAGIYLTSMIVVVVLLAVSVVWMLVLRRELAKRREAEREAKTRYSTLKSIVDSASALVFSVDGAYRYTSFNLQHALTMEQIYGVEIRLGGSLLDYMTVEEDRTIAHSNLDRALSGEQFTMESYSGEELRSRRYFQVAHSPIRQDGQIIGVVVFAYDVTAIKQVEDDLRESEKRYKLLLASVTSYIYTVKVDGGRAVSTQHGAGCEAVTGRKPEQLEQDPLLWFKMIYEPDREAVREQVANVLAGRAVAPFEHRIVHSDGQLRWIRNTTVSHFDSEQRLTSYDGLIVDITPEKNAEEAQQRAAKLETVGLLAGGIAHDFNNLLAGIFGYISLARKFLDDPAKAGAYLDKAGSVFQRAKALTQQLLTFSKTNVPRIQTQMLGPLVRKAVTFSLAGSRVVFDLDLPDGLWPVSVDENQIGQVLDNLIINAQQAMPQGGQIRISALNVTLEEGEVPPLPPGRYVKLAVADEGPGIPDALKNRIFEPFFSTKQSGQGLGLATCNSIVSKHRGAIRVESGPGTTFTVFLPASADSICPDPPPQTSGHRGSGTILVLDDEDSVREILATKLRRMGYDVLEAPDGNTALQICSAVPNLQAAILDLTVRGGPGGVEILPELRKRYPGIPVFATSGYFEDPVMANPADFGFTDRLQKPYLDAELETLLQKNLGAP